MGSQVIKTYTEGVVKGNGVRAEGLLHLSCRAHK